jgi:hypothetical protein
LNLDVEKIVLEKKLKVIQKKYPVERRRNAKRYNEL